MSITTILILCFFVISIIGTLLHFTHNWLKNGLLLHIFSAVNESTWEHMKLLVAPTLVVVIFQVIILKNIYANPWNGLLSLFLVEIITIPLLYEPLRIMFKEIPLLLTILIFYLAIALGLLSEYCVLTNSVYFVSEVMAILTLLILTILFGIFTYFPPKWFLFKDPVSRRYGDVK